MHIKIPHKGTRAAAVSALKRSLDEARPQMQKEATIHEERWEGETLYFDVTAQKQRISGTLKVEDTELVLDAKLPLMLRLFEGKIEREIAERIKQMA